MSGVQRLENKGREEREKRRKSIERRKKGGKASEFKREKMKQI